MNYPTIRQKIRTGELQIKKVDGLGETMGLTTTTLTNLSPLYYYQLFIKAVDCKDRQSRAETVVIKIKN